MAPKEHRDHSSRTELARQQRKLAAMQKAAQRKEEFAALARLRAEKERS